MPAPRLAAVLSCLLPLALGACAGDKGGAAQDALYLEPARYSDLPGWQDDDVAAALVPLRKSCARIMNKASGQSFSAAAPYAGMVADWQRVCDRLPPPDANTQTVRVFFENNFRPYALSGEGGYEGLFTGYYEPLLTAVPADAGPEEGTPLYARPADMIAVNLGDFRPELKGETITGRVVGEKLVPYHARAEIERGALRDAALPLVRVDDPIAAFFLHVQGSGRVSMPDGTSLRVGYAAQNGRPYVAIGKVLIDEGELTRENVSMQSIRQWMLDNPARAQELMDQNPSYVFFRVLEASEDEGPLGAEGVPLTPLRSLAVDRRKLPYGAPVFVDVADDPSSSTMGKHMTRLMVAQDTGGAIRGTVRGDVYWGTGELAAAFAGIMKSKGRAWILLPATVTPPDDMRPRPWWSKLAFWRKAGAA